MTKRAFDKIAAGLRDAAAFAHGTADRSRYGVHVPAEIDVKALRTRIGMTQERFASAFGFPLSTVRDWEQRRARPETTARAYLLLISRAPEFVEETLRDANKAA